MEAVAETEVRVDEALARQGLLELRAQLADVDVDRALLLAERPCPDHRVELLAAYDPPAAARQCGQQAQLPHGQRERAPVRERQELARPDLEAALPQDFVRRRFHYGPEVHRKRRKLRYENVTVL